VYAEWGMALVLGPLAGWQALRAVRAWLAHRHFRDSYRPLHTALAPVLDIPDATPPRSWLEVPHDYGRRPDAEIVVYPPEGFTASERARDDVTRAVTAKLGIEAPESSWELDKRPPRIVFRKSVPPPAKVTARDILPAIA